MKKIRLLTPGPTPVPERLSLRMARPIVHHRSPEFEAVFARVREGLAWLYQTKQDVLVFAASGTGAMEASFVNFLRRGDSVIRTRGVAWAGRAPTAAIARRPALAVERARTKRQARRASSSATANFTPARRNG